MDSILSCMTAGHNIYTINRERKQLFLTHPQLVPHLYNLKSATPFPKCYLHKEKWTFDS